MVDTLGLFFSKAVVGMAFDPFNSYRFATYAEDADGLVKVPPPTARC